uniref:Uncharacterized protein n=1 Tax=Cacopsylla melanoneura TaxID=428564 RepID=A0A8D8RYS5_9HEMI
MPSTIESSMGPLSTKLSPSKGSVAKSDGAEEGVYYAVYIPTELLGGYENEFLECGRVFDNKEEALLFIKKNKKIRFKSFQNFQDAQNFAYNGYAGGGNDGGNTDSLLSSPSSLAVEKPSPFKSLKSQELVKLRKLIEKGNLA